MGAAGSSLEDCEEQAEFYRLWMESSRDERHTLGVKIGKKTAQLLEANTKKPIDVKGALANFVRTEILGRRVPRKRR
jgi:hypothetical protein